MKCWIVKNCKDKKTLKALQEAMGEYQELRNQLKLKYPHALRNKRFK